MVISRVCALIALASSVLAVALADSAAASGRVRTLLRFDAAAGELPEGVALDASGNVFMSLAPKGRVLRLHPRSARPTAFGRPIRIDQPGDPGLLGLATDGRGDVYGAVMSASAAVRGIWRFERRTGARRRLPGTQAIPFPNGLAFDDRGNLYVASSADGQSASGNFMGGIWRVSRRGSVRRLAIDEALGGTGAFRPGGTGANGIAYRRGLLYVTNTEKATLLAVPVRHDGTLGAFHVLASGPRLTYPDGLTLDMRGNAYVAVITQSAVVRVTRHGVITPVADSADGLDWPSSLTFGVDRARQHTLYVVNYAIGAKFGGQPGAGPALLSIDVATGGQHR